MQHPNYYNLCYYKRASSSSLLVITFALFFFYANTVIRYKVMSEVESLWCQIGKVNGTETRLLLQKPVDLQDEMVLLQAHRQLLAREVVHKGIVSCLSYLPGSFSAQAMRLHYAALVYSTRAQLNELPEWADIFKRWVELKFAPDVGDEQLLRRLGELEGLESEEMMITFVGCIAESILQCLMKKHMKLRDIEQLSFKGQGSMMVKVSASHLLSFLTQLLPKTLFNVVLKANQLPPSLRNNKQLQCLYSNSEAQFAVKNSPAFSILLRVLFQMILGKFGELQLKEERVLMEAAFRYFFLHHHERTHQAAEILIECFNIISQSVRFAMTEDFLLFLRIACKLGKEKLVNMMIQKSSWLRQISEKTGTNKMMGHKLEDVGPFNSLLSHRIQVGRGQKEIRYFQCVENYSIVVLKVIIEDLDIDIRIRHEGDLITKEVPTMETILYQKVSMGFVEINVFPKRGIYSIEFDNSYSWINSKNISFERIILTPLSYHSPYSFPFLAVYYVNKPMNSVTTQNLIRYGNSTSPRIHIRIKENIFGFTLEDQRLQAYQYQTDDPHRFLQKLTYIAKSKQNVEFCIGNKTLKSVEEVEAFLKEITADREAKRKEKEVLIEIPLKY